jgi:cell division protein FtsI/penicillin-binding protein 2
VAVGALAVFARLVQVQLVDHSDYAREADAILDVNRTFYGHRGAVLDRNNNVLAVTQTTWDLYIRTEHWDDPEVAAKAAETIGAALKLSPDRLRVSVKEHGFGDLLIARDVPFEVGEGLIKEKVKGLVALENIVRINPAGDVGAQLVGVIGGDNVGLSGVEWSMNSVLQGRPGEALYERDTTGSPIPFGRYVLRQPVDGRDVVLTIDSYLQGRAEQLLDEAVKAHKAKGGTIVIMDPRSGEILALASSPRVKLSNLNLDDPRTHELMKLNWVTDAYEPGSTLKAVTAAAAIDQGVVTPETYYQDTGEWTLYDRTLKNWKDGVWGSQSMLGVLQQSINTGAIFMAWKLGPEQFTSYLDRFGFGQPTGIEFTAESPGIFPHPGDPDWTPVTWATQAYGQGIGVTPLQLVQAYGAIVNGGYLIRPRIVKAYVDPDGTRHEVPTDIRRSVISPETSATMRKMLNAVVDPPDNLHPGKPRLFSAGGKSGTADILATGKQIISFAGFAPVEDPRIVVLVKLDENADEQTGTEAAAPVFAQLVDEALVYMNVDPNADRRVERR